MSALIDLLPLAALVAATAAAAWEPRPRWLLRALRSSGLRSVSLLFLGIWIALALSFCFYFWGRQGFWQLLASLVEIAGVTYLAREVYIAQEFEEYRRVTGALKPFVELEPLVERGKLEEYVVEYYKLDGRPESEAQADISALKQSGTLAEEVEGLRSKARRSFDRPDGPLADRTFEYRRARLLRGIVLIVLAAAGHAVHALGTHEEAETALLRAKLERTQSQLDQLDSEFQKAQADAETRIAHITKVSDSHADEIAGIIAEHKRWHVKRRKSSQAGSPVCPDGSSCNAVCSACEPKVSPLR